MNQCVLFDWGDTVMRDFPQFTGPMESWPEVAPVVGVRPILELVRTAACIGLATNAADSDEPAIRRALARCQLDGFFPDVFCIGSVGVPKTDPAFYEAVAASLRLPARSVFMVGDTFESDAAAPNSVGMPAVWFNRSSDEVRQGELLRTIHTLAQLPTALRALGAHMP